VDSSEAQLHSATDEIRPENPNWISIIVIFIVILIFIFIFRLFLYFHAARGLAPAGGSSFYSDWAERKPIVPFPSGCAVPFCLGIWLFQLKLFHSLRALVHSVL
jgi:hypothetical protein